MKLVLMLIGGVMILIGANGHIYYVGKRQWPLNIILASIGFVLFVIGLNLTA